MQSYKRFTCHFVIAAGAATAVACTTEPGLIAGAVEPASDLTPVGVAESRLGDSLRVQVTDPQGAPLAGASVAWSASDGTVSPAVARTDAAGVAAASWLLGKAATQQATATVTGLTPVTFTAEAIAQRFELETSFLTYTYFVFCPGSYAYCSRTEPAGDARLSGTMRYVMTGDTILLAGQPGGGSVFTGSSWSAYLDGRILDGDRWVASLRGRGASEYLRMSGTRVADTIAGNIEWVLKSGPSGSHYAGTFVMRAVR